MRWVRRVGVWRRRGRVETSSISLAPRQEVVNAKFAQDLIHYINQTDVSILILIRAEKPKASLKNAKRYPFSPHANDTITVIAPKTFYCTRGNI